MKYKLSEICDYAKDKIDVSVLDENTYISTENMMPNKGGITKASTLPAISQTQSFSVGDVLVSNIRPYFKKIWLAEYNGGCSNDVLVFRARNGVSNRFLYYVLADDAFFDYSMATSKGTKMPRGDKDAIMKYDVPNFKYEEQEKIAAILGALDDKIELNQKINDNLERQAQAIFENWLAECDEKITIGELCENILDYSKCTNNEVVLINSSDVTNGHFEHHTLSLNSNLKGHFKKRFKKWDILFSEIRPRNHHFAYCQFDPTNYIASTRLMVLRNRSSMISSSLLYRYLMLNDVLEEFILKTESRSGTFPQGCFEDLSRITVSYSPIKRQEEINGAIEDIHSLSWNIEKENQQLSAIRDSLLPRLMSGELDVSNLEI